MKKRIRSHLGLKLHRFLAKRIIRIHVEIEDIVTGDVGPTSQVLPTNPFPIRGTNGASGYPKILTVQFPGAGRVKMRAHIWRKKSKEEGYKLGGGSVAEHQGFYFFRHDRLIQAEDGVGIIGTNEPHMSLARVEIDIPDALSDYLKVRSNKAGVEYRQRSARQCRRRERGMALPLRIFYERQRRCTDVAGHKSPGLW